MPINKYKLILFDLDNTLFDFDSAQRLAMRRTIEVHDLPAGNAVVELRKFQGINDRLWKALERGEIERDEVLLGRWKELFDYADLDYAAVDQTFLEGLAEHKRLFPGVAELLQELRNRGYILSIVTNGVGWIQKENLAKSEIARLITALVISDEVGVAKPAPQIFEEALRQSSWMEKQSTLMVGDSLSSDIAGAKAFGLDTCFYNPGGIPHEADPNYEVRALEELLGILNAC